MAEDYGNSGIALFERIEDRDRLAEILRRLGFIISIKYDHNQIGTGLWSITWRK